ncbi:MAG: bifunctional DNA primase/polymerase [Lachnospiraceae bacterium]|nr:bifunctional DNA primase/polymerase [Lachnospiraceae bacterium]
MKEAEAKNPLLEWALRYADMGIAVFPVVPGKKYPVPYGWQDFSTTDPDKIRRLWGKAPAKFDSFRINKKGEEEHKAVCNNPRYNIGIDCGKSGLFVIDYDTANGKKGLDVRDNWRKSHVMPTTWTASTPRGGKHEYYRGNFYGNAEGLYGCVDIRAAGGLVVAPPSVFQESVYSWEVSPILYPLAEADNTVLSFLKSAPEGFDQARRKEPYKVPDKIYEGGRTSALVALAGMLIAKGLTPEAAAAAITKENEERCVPNLTYEELEREVFPALTRPSWQQSTAPYTRDLPIKGDLIERLSSLDVVHNKRYGLNDAGSARLFMDACGDCVQYAEDRKKWLYYDGRRWNVNGENSAKERLKHLVDAFVVYVIQNVQEENRRIELLKYAGKLQQYRSRKTILEDAQSVRPIRSDSLDTDPQVFNCQNGTLDLKTLEFREHSPGDMLTHLADVNYDPSATSPRWESFIDEVTGGDRELARYIQKAAGYTLTGDNLYECLFVCYGPTARNGKSTLLETIAAMMGDYAANASPESFTKQKNRSGSQHSEDIARLAGVRFVVVAEPERRMELNASLVKALTGRDKITTRRLNESSFEYVPAFKLFFNANHRPHIDDMTVFESDRIKLIPFNEHFGADRRDLTLKSKLRTPGSLSGVLNWCLEGLRMIRQEGFTEPAAVREATMEYRRKSDKLLQFLEDRTEQGAGFEVPLSELHSAFAAWCITTGVNSVSIPAFKEMLEERQLFTKRKRPAGSGRSGKKVMHVLGVRLLKETV